MPEDDLPPDLPDHLQERVAKLFRAHGVPQEEAEEIVANAAVEAWRRRHRGPTQEARFLRAVERACRAYKEELRRRALESLDEADGGGS